MRFKERLWRRQNIFFILEYSVCTKVYVLAICLPSVNRGGPWNRLHFCSSFLFWNLFRIWKQLKGNPSVVILEVIWSFLVVSFLSGSISFVFLKRFGFLIRFHVSFLSLCIPNCLYFLFSIQNRCHRDCWQMMFAELGKRKRMSLKSLSSFLRKCLLFGYPNYC